MNPNQTMPIRVSGHAFSEDGLNWHYDADDQPYNNELLFENGTKQYFSTKERPHLVFNDEGEPTHLINGVSPFWETSQTEGPCDGYVLSQ